MTLSGNWLPQSSHLGRGLGFSSRILIHPPQFWLINYERKPFYVWEDPGQTGKGQVNISVDRKISHRTPEVGASSG